ncbi:hypothetical protein DDE05_27275 [Streptomyces cavourensis]|nr:hypothetical protein DDE05_27275 [Streptomyces cavourensis]
MPWRAGDLRWFVSGDGHQRSAVLPGFRGGGGRGAVAACAAWRGGVFGGGRRLHRGAGAWRRWPGRTIGLCAAASIGLCLGAVNAAAQAQLRLGDALADEHQNEVARLVLRVAELPDGDARGQRFVGEQVAPARAGMPSRILVSWLAPPGGQANQPLLMPGQVWRMALVLRRPSGLLNPEAPDSEARMFARGLRATGTVRGQPRLLEDQPWASAGIAIERARHHVREGLRRALGDHRYAPVLIALAIGDQAGVARVADQNRSEPVFSGRGLIPKEIAESGQFHLNN